MSDYNRFSNYPRSVYRRVATESSFQILCFLLLCVHVFTHVYSCSHLCVCACVCEIQRLTRNVLPNCSPPFFETKSLSLSQSLFIWEEGLLGAPEILLLCSPGLELNMSWGEHVTVPYFLHGCFGVNSGPYFYTE